MTAVELDAFYAEVDERLASIDRKLAVISGVVRDLVSRRQERESQDG